MKKLIYSATLVLALSLAACSDTTDYSPQEILNEAMKETSALNSYYSEYTTTIEDGTTIDIKQWQKDGKIRTEAIDSNGEETWSINDGTSITSYTKNTNTAMIFDLGEDSEAFVQPSMREQALRMLDLIQDTHTITTGADEKIAGHDTYHLIATTKKEDSLIGNMEFWVDKKTWMTLKTVSESGDIKMTSEYTKFEPNAEIDDSDFVLDLPEDAIIEEETVEMPTAISIEQAEQRLGKFLTLPTSSGYTIDTIEDMNMTETGEIALTYVKDDMPQFTISVFKPLQPIGDEEQPLTIRNVKGSVMDTDFFRFVQWDEGDLRYNIIVENMELTIDDIVKIADEMTMTP